MVDNTREHFTHCSHFPRPCDAWKNTSQLVKYPRVLSTKTPNKGYVYSILAKQFSVLDGTLLYNIIQQKQVSFRDIERGKKPAFETLELYPTVYEVCTYLFLISGRWHLISTLICFQYNESSAICFTALFLCLCSNAGLDFW